MDQAGHEEILKKYKIRFRKIEISPMLQSVPIRVMLNNTLKRYGQTKRSLDDLNFGDLRFTTINPWMVKLVKIVYVENYQS